MIKGKQQLTEYVQTEHFFKFMITFNSSLWTGLEIDKKIKRYAKTGDKIFYAIFVDKEKEGPKDEKYKR